jgi:hypothetical protein
MKFYVRKLGNKYPSIVLYIMGEKDYYTEDKTLATLYPSYKDAREDMKPGEIIVKWTVKESDMGLDW